MSTCVLERPTETTEDGWWCEPLDDDPLPDVQQLTGLSWLMWLDDEDRLEFMAEMLAAADAVVEVRAQILADWHTTALALADADRREVLLGTVGPPTDFVSATRPE